MLSVLIKTTRTLLTCQCQTEDKKAEEFQILLFFWSFSSDIVAVKGLNKDLFILFTVLITGVDHVQTVRLTDVRWTLERAKRSRPAPISNFIWISGNKMS